MGEIIGVWMPVGKNMFTLIDREAQPLWEGLNWFVCRAGRTKVPYVGRNFKYGYYDYRNKKLHSLLIPCPAGYVIDHINGDTLDNRIDNLRICSQAQNSCNRSPHKQYKGVSLLPCGKWRSYIHYNRKFKSLGSYATAWDAAQAYNKKALELWGEYAKLNVYNEKWGIADDYRALSSVRRTTARINAGEASR